RLPHFAGSCVLGPRGMRRPRCGRCAATSRRRHHRAAGHGGGDRFGYGADGNGRHIRCAFPREVFAEAMARHMTLVGASVGAAAAIGFPLGVATARRPGLQGPVFAVLNILQTIPSIALFGLLIVPLSALVTAVPRLAAFGVGGIGVAPALIALVLYALLPVVRSTSVGLTGVDSAAIEAGRG